MSHKKKKKKKKQRGRRNGERAYERCRDEWLMNKNNKKKKIWRGWVGKVERFGNG